MDRIKQNTNLIQYNYLKQLSKQTVSHSQTVQYIQNSYEQFTVYSKQIILQDCTIIGESQWFICESLTIQFTGSLNLDWLSQDKFSNICLKITELAPDFLFKLREFSWHIIVQHVDILESVVNLQQINFNFPKLTLVQCQLYNQASSLMKVDDLIIRNSELRTELRNQNTHKQKPYCLRITLTGRTSVSTDTFALYMKLFSMIFQVLIIQIFWNAFRALIYRFQLLKYTNSTITGIMPTEFRLCSSKIFWKLKLIMNRRFQHSIQMKRKRTESLVSRNKLSKLNVKYRFNTKN
ncbi:Hypothetical_protein [Hexamita inflata]|uniref:Hypothetical_protein n=1 Tax=Hexamita inflata TaxID=28002 RepID=A0AA86QF56_9EUKA|nr:Hypothetical protein HINF_LOCUS45185 [Hexamita inflata]